MQWSRIGFVVLGASFLGASLWADGSAAAVSPTVSPESTPVAKNDAPGALKLGNKLLSEGQYRDAIAYFNGIGEQVAANGHKKREPYRLLGLSSAYVNLGMNDLAGQSAAAALDIDPLMEGAWNNLALAKGQEGKRAEAEALYQKGIDALTAAHLDAARLQENLHFLKMLDAQIDAKTLSPTASTVTGTAATR